MAKYSKVIYAVLIFMVCTGGVLWIAGAGSLLFAWVLNLMLMMVTLAVMQALRPALASTYYDSKTWEAEGRMYKWIGIDTFRRLLVLIGWERFNKHSVRVNRKAEAIQHLEYTSRQSALGHIIIFVIVLGIAIIVAYVYGIRASMWLMSLNILLNAYPMMLQRYNRPRYQRALQKSKMLSFV